MLMLFVFTHVTMLKLAKQKISCNAENLKLIFVYKKIYFCFTLSLNLFCSTLRLGYSSKSKLSYNTLFLCSCMVVCQFVGCIYWVCLDTEKNIYICMYCTYWRNSDDLRGTATATTLSKILNGYIQLSNNCTVSAFPVPVSVCISFECLACFPCSS